MKTVITNKMRSEARKILQKIYAAVIEDEKENESEYEMWFSNELVHNYLSDYGYSLAAGMTRTVWVCDDFVLKFPHNAGLTHYCEHEEEVYQKSIEWGYDEMFAQCERLDEVGGVPVWIMELVDIDEDRVYENSDYHQSGEDEEDEYWRYDCCEAARQMLERDWGVSVIAELYRFLEMFKVNDIHDNNIGCNGHKFIICDYAGFQYLLFIGIYIIIFI